MSFILIVYNCSRALGTPYAPPPKKKAISMQEELARIAADLDIDSLRTSVAR